MHFVSDPGNLTLFAVPRLWIDGEEICSAAAGISWTVRHRNRPSSSIYCAFQTSRQNTDRRQFRQPWLLHGGVDRGEKLAAIGADGGRQFKPRCLGLGEDDSSRRGGRTARAKPPGARARSQSGATIARSFSAARMVSPARSSRLRPRTAAKTCVELVRCRPPDLDQTFVAQVARRRVSSSSRAAPAHDQARTELTQNSVVEAGIGQ